VFKSYKNTRRKRLNIFYSMVLVVYLISRRSENKRRLRKIDFCFTVQCDRPWILQLQIYHRIQFQKWQFLYWFLVIITSWNADSCPYRQRETKIVCKFVYKKKKRKKKQYMQLFDCGGLRARSFWTPRLCCDPPTRW
jgi:hypothetical protein